MQPNNLTMIILTNSTTVTTQRGSTSANGITTKMFDDNLKNAITYSVMKFVEEYDGDLLARYTKRGWRLDIMFPVEITADNPADLFCKNIDLLQKLDWLGDKEKYLKLEYNSKDDKFVCNFFYLVKDDCFKEEFLELVEKIKDLTNYY